MYTFQNVKSVAHTFKQRNVKWSYVLWHCLSFNNSEKKIFIITNVYRCDKVISGQLALFFVVRKFYNNFKSINTTFL